MSAHRPRAAKRAGEHALRQGELSGRAWDIVALRVIEIVEVREVLVSERLQREELHGSTLD